MALELISTLTDERQVSMYLLKDLDIIIMLLRCHESGHEKDADLATGLCSHPQPRSLESAVEAGGCLVTALSLSRSACLFC